jgi:hypothetical protein
MALSAPPLARLRRVANLMATLGPGAQPGPAAASGDSHAAGPLSDSEAGSEFDS